MKNDLSQAVQAAVLDLFAVDMPTSLTRPEEQFGDYATNVAMQLAKPLGQNPRQIAETLAAELRTRLADQISAVSVAGPGFINLTVADPLLAQAYSSRTTAAPLKGQTVLVEYSDPNPFKPLHAGHLYTTLMGDAISRLVERGGAEVIRLNYGGDVGLHVAKSMWGILRDLGGESPDKLQDIPENTRPQWLGSCYVAGTSAYEDDETAKAEIISLNRRVYQLQADGDHETPFAQIYWTCRDWSYAYFKVLYNELEVKPFNRFIPESEVTQLGITTVEAELDKGVYKRSEGAVVFDGEAFGLHTRVFINQTGLPTYEAKEVGLLLTKWRDYNFDQSIVITASEQEQYMKVVLKSIEQFEPVPISRTKHLTHGVVKLQGGVKMSSRRGNIVSALDIIEAAQQAGTEREQPAGRETVLAAIKYALLKPRIGGDVVYDPKESIALEGNSGPYLQYAHARARSILAKATEQAQAVASDDTASSSAVSDGEHDTVFTPGERSLARKLSEYTEVVDAAVADLMPHLVCTYLYELAQTFNGFYEHNRVIGDERQPHRLKLVEAYADTLRDGLNLLGITAPDRM